MTSRCTHAASSNYDTIHVKLEPVWALRLSLTGTMRLLTHSTVRLVSTPTRQKSSLLDCLRRNAPIDVHPEVADALATNKPVVALESTIITHGMPQPKNLETARSVENIVRSTGSIPATIGLLGGRVKIGLQPSELEYLADIGSNPSVVKLSRRDIAPAIAQKRDGGTTCSATLIFAELAGIKASAMYKCLSKQSGLNKFCRSSQPEGELFSTRLI